MELLPSEILATNKFDQCVLSLALINICNQDSPVGQAMKERYNAWKSETDDPINNPWLDLHQFTIYVPHPEQTYEEITLEEGLTLGYNVEVEPIVDHDSIPYNIPEGGHFVAVLKQKKINGEFKIAATGMFIQPLAALSLDIVTDPDEGKYESMVIKHPIIRDYPQDFVQQISQYLNKEIHFKQLPNLVGYVDQSQNPDYRQPSWQELYLEGQGIKLF
ncbi:hypothetical protein [Cyanothece sp. BG0011]|uniref:hypothetical protein n=1 Tax=Cyanothece sp. BG0011 TaxID=2082950 RepID=UPI000D1DCAD2|nr:hypothetical protein [Cyanothece sp. BG0011]